MIAIETALCDIFSILKAGEIYSPFFLTFYNMNTTYIVHFLFSILKMTCMKLYYERFQRLS